MFCPRIVDVTKALQEFNFDVKHIVVIVGSNDLAAMKGQWDIPLIKEKYATMLQTARICHPNSSLHVTQILPRAYVHPQRIQGFNNYQRAEVTMSGGSVIHLPSQFWDRDSGMYMTDNIHLSRKGLPTLASSIISHLHGDSHELPPRSSSDNARDSYQVATGWSNNHNRVQQNVTSDCRFTGINTKGGDQQIHPTGNTIVNDGAHQNLPRDVTLKPTNTYDLATRNDYHGATAWNNQPMNSNNTCNYSNNVDGTVYNHHATRDNSCVMGVPHITEKEYIIGNTQVTPNWP